MRELLISGSLFKDMILTGAAFLERNKNELNALNVFPVPDGDTGTNMSLTLYSAIKEMQNCDTSTVAAVADAVAMGALRGARGNSGVILSQVFRGFAKSVKGVEKLNAKGFAAAMRQASEDAYKAVMRPKEGTMLTVGRMIAEAVEKAESRGANLLTLMDVVIESGEEALKLTPELLPVLKEAGVIDAGGKGLLMIYQGFKLALDGEELPEYVFDDSAAPAPKTMAAGDIHFIYCTEFLISNLSPSFKRQDLEKLNTILSRIGDSLVVVEDRRLIKVHVHTNVPGKVLQLALRLGELDGVKIDNMLKQHREIYIQQPQKEIGTVAVSCGDGLDKVFRNLAVDSIIRGGQTMNPSAQEIASAIAGVNAKNVFVLPNNPNVILAAQQAAKLSSGKKVTVIPAKSIPEGLSAIMTFNADLSCEENKSRMTGAISAVKSGSVTYAVRDTRIKGLKLHKGDIIGLNSESIKASGDDINTVAADLLHHMITDDDEFVTIFYGADVTEESAQALKETVSQEIEDCEFVVQHGGQPLYYYIFSVE